jgi:hypothetical protein
MNDTCSPSLCFSSINNGETWELIEAPLTAVRNEDVGCGWSGTFLDDGNTLYELNNYYNGYFNEIRFGTARILNGQMIVSTANYKIKNAVSGYFLDDPEGSSTPGTQLIQNSQNGLFTQSYCFFHIADDLYTAKCNHNDLYMDVINKNDYPVVLEAHIVNENQQWRIVPQEHRSFKLQNAGNNYWMDTLGQSIEEGTGIVCTKNDTKSTQEWSIEQILHVTRFESFNISKRFIRHLENKTVIIDVEFTTLPLEDSQWFVWPGLADRNFVSFESANFPDYYLRHYEGRIYIAKFEESPQFRSDATFRIHPGLADSTFISLETFNFDGIYVRHRDGILIISDIVSDLDRADATFRDTRQ